MKNLQTRRLKSCLTGLIAKFCIAVCLPMLASVNGSTVTELKLVPAKPQLNLILPRGVQRGGQYVLQFLGARLENSAEVFLYDPSPGVTVTGFTQVDANRIDVAITVSADCRLGEHVAQVRTRDGMSDFRSFFVGALPAVDEVEPNTSLGEAQAIALNVTVAGVVENEDIDYFRFAGKQGQRVSVEIEAIRLGYMFDSAIALLDQDRFEVAVSDDTPLTKQDGWFSVILPKDGDYFVTVREASFRGNGDCRYRLHIGEFSRPTAVLPAGGKPGETLKLKFLERLGGAGPGVNWVEQEVTLPAAESFRSGLFFTDDKGISPSPVPFRLSPLENVFEQEPNDTWPETPALDLVALTQGVALNGVIGTPADYDYFRFQAKQNQVWYITCHARSIGSGLDPVMHVFGADKGTLAGNDDNGTPDSFIRFQVPADGEYYVRVYDHLLRGQADFVYRIELAPSVPKLSIGVTRNDRYSQERQTIAVPQGSRFAVLVDASRIDFAGELELIGDNLPAGITMKAMPMKDNLTSMPVVFEAAPDAAIGGAMVDFRARHIDPATNIQGGFLNLADFALGEPNNRLYYGCTVNRLAMAVVEPLPFRLELVQPQVPLVRDGVINIKVVAHRNEGFVQPIHVQFPFRGPGVGTTNQITIPAEASELLYPLNANGAAQLGKWPMYVIGFAESNGPAWTSTQLAELEIAEPYIKMEFERASVELGQPTKLYCKIQQLTPFEGEATAEILGIPPNITINTPLKFTKDSTELSFEVQTTAASPVGKHGLFCQVTIIQNGEPVVSRAGNVELQINQPLPPKEITAPTIQP